MYRIDENPLPRYPESRALEDDIGHWRVAHLKSRREKSFARALKEKGIGYYLPLYTKRTRRKDNDKTRKSVCPLFSGYMAVVFDEETFGKLGPNKDLVMLLPVVDQNRFVRELNQVKTILEKGLDFHVQNGFAAGTPVKVLSGALAGLEGVVLKKERESRLVIGIDMFGQSISVTMNGSEVTTA